MCFDNKNSQNVNYSSNSDYSTGHFIDFSPKKSDFLSKCDCISSTILTFLPNNPVCFYNKNSQKVNFSSNYANNTVHFIDFSPKESDLFLKMRMHIKHYFDAKFVQKTITKNGWISRWTVVFWNLLTFLTKKVIFSSKCACISSTILTFLPNNPVCFYNINSKKVNFPLNCEYNTRHFIDFSP